MTRLAIALASFGLASCSVLAPKPDITRNYLLTEQAPVGDVRPARISLAVGPIILPAYLDRAEIVTREPPNKIHLSSLERWAEPLRENFTRVFTADLAAAAGADEVVEFPWHGRPAVDYRVTVDVEQFERRSDGVAVIVARWRLRRGLSKTILHSTRSTHEVHIDGSDTEHAVEALSRATALLAQEIAAAIRDNPEPAH